MVVTPSLAPAPAGRHRVLVIGSGFGGLFATQALRREPVEVTLVSRTTAHLFQPLLYQVATGILSPGEIAPATREILKRQRNATVVLGEVTDIDLHSRVVTASSMAGDLELTYDSLVVAAGAGQSYFGNDHFARYAPGMKDIDDALELRGRILGAFEVAEAAAVAGGPGAAPDELGRLLTFVVVGAGPTGVEMAGQIAELAHRTLARDFRHIDPRTARIVLLDAAPQVLPSFGDRLGDKARRELERVGVEVVLGAKVVDLDGRAVTYEDADGHRIALPSACVVWAAGVSASPLGEVLARQSGAELDRAGRVLVEPDLTLPGHPEVFVVGDLMALDRLPGVAQVAIQGARFAARQIGNRLACRPTEPRFGYHDKGSMATISRFSAVASIGRLRLTGFPAWLLWLAIHLVYIIGFKHRVTTLLHWAVSFLGRGRAERVITEQQVLAREIIDDIPDRPRPDPAA
ncbi:MAG TPA: NAD(P)/FAD-dependent oxidoreductase [Dermatophilaceae bacterium]|nr:NAD(P)/FAD-dependent oxidoreductase [Dermatophilaceae bacterium]